MIKDNLKLYIVETKTWFTERGTINGPTTMIEEKHHILASHEHFAKAWVAARCGSESYSKEHNALRKDVEISKITEETIGAVIRDESLMGILGT